MFGLLAATGAYCVRDFRTQELANVAWAFATASESDVLLFAALAAATEISISTFNVQDLANTV